jgi:hypothetical protein
MEYFQTKNPNLGIFLGGPWNRKYFMAIWNI